MKHFPDFYIMRLQNTDKQEVKKKITWEGDYPYANSTDIFCVEKNNLFSYDINGENKRKYNGSVVKTKI